MRLQLIDFWVILTYLIFVLLIGFLCRKVSGKNKEEYFLAGRNIPWWLAGISIVATTFAADTPLAICGIIAAKACLEIGSGSRGWEFMRQSLHIFRRCMAQNRRADRCSVYFNKVFRKEKRGASASESRCKRYSAELHHTCLGFQGNVENIKYFF